MNRLLAAALLVLAGCVKTGLEQEEAICTTLRPKLEWQTFPPEAYLKKGADWVVIEATKVSYDLRIYRADDFELVYSRDALPAAGHVVEEPLQPKTVYRWTVRPRFEVRGLPRVGEWSSVAGVETHRRSLLPREQDLYATFKTPPAPSD